MGAHFGLQSLATEASPRALGRDNGATEELLGQLVQAIHFVYPYKAQKLGKEAHSKAPPDRKSDFRRSYCELPGLHQGIEWSASARESVMRE